MAGEDKGALDSTAQAPAEKVGLVVMGLPVEASPAAADHGAELPTGSSRFEVGREIGRGGMGAVVEATDRQFQRRVAVKQLLDTERPLARHRFENEALITGNLEHPGIPTVYERGRDAKGRPFYAMRLVAGKTFKELLAGARTPAERLGLLDAPIKVAEALGYAHAKGVIHRDLKPANIVVGHHGEAVILDWGLAKVRGLASTLRDGATASAPGEGATSASDAVKTHDGSVVGTPAYMSPEQAQGKNDELDERSDVFSLGLMLYELLSGRRGYDGATSMMIMVQAGEGRLPALAQVAPEAPPALVAICEKATARLPQDRYKNASELAAALEGFRAQAVSGRPSQAVDRAVGIFTMAFACVALTVAIGWWALFPTMPQVLLAMLLSLASGAMATVEWRSRGRQALATVGYGLAALTLAVGLAASAVGLSQVLAVAAQPAWQATPERLAALLTKVRPAVGTLPSCAILAGLQVLMWGTLLRRLELMRRAGGST